MTSHENAPEDTTAERPADVMGGADRPSDDVLGEPNDPPPGDDALAPDGGQRPKHRRDERR